MVKAESGSSKTICKYTSRILLLSIAWLHGELRNAHCKTAHTDTSQEMPDREPDKGWDIYLNIGSSFLLIFMYMKVGRKREGRSELWEFRTEPSKPKGKA